MTEQEAQATPAPATVPERAAPRPTWTPWSRRVATIALLLGVTWIVYLSRSVIRMLLVAAIVAFLVQPAVRRLEGRGLSRSASVLVVYLAFVGLAVLVLALLIPQVLGQLTALSHNAWQFLLQGQSRTVQALESLRHVSVAGAALDLSVVVDPALSAIEEAAIPANLMPSPESLVGSAQAALRTMSGLVVGFAGLVATLVFTVFFAMRMNLDGPAIVAGLGRFAGDAQNAEHALLLDRVGMAWSGFFRGQVKLSFVVGLAVWLGAVVLGLPGALLLGILAGVLEVLPSLGPILATVPAVVIALTQGSTHFDLSRPVFAAIVLLFYVAVQQLENTLFVPRIMGRALQLPPLVVMVAVVIGAKVGGILGAFVAAPCVATAKVIGEYTLAKARGLDPFPDETPPAAGDRTPAAGTQASGADGAGAD